MAGPYATYVFLYVEPRVVSKLPAGRAVIRFHAQDHTKRSAALAYYNYLKSELGLNDAQVEDILENTLVQKTQFLAELSLASARYRRTAKRRNSRCIRN